MERVMSPTRLDKILNDISEGILPDAPYAELCQAMKALAKRESDLINHYQGTMSNLMIAIAESQQTFLRLRGLIK